MFKTTLESTNDLLTALGLSVHWVAVNVPDMDVDLEEYKLEISLAWVRTPTEPFLFIYSYMKRDEAITSILGYTRLRKIFQVSTLEHYPGGRDDPGDVDIIEICEVRYFGEAIQAMICEAVKQFSRGYFDAEADREMQKWERDHAVEIEEARNNAEGYLMERDAEAYAADPEGYMARGDLAYDAARERGEV